MTRPSGRNSPQQIQQRATPQSESPTPITRPAAQAPVRRLTEEGIEVNEAAGKLLDAIRSINQKRNVVTIDEFRRYEPLFRKPTHAIELAEEHAIKDLSNEFTMRFDPYHEIQITDATKTKVVLILPRIFTQMRPAENNLYADVAFSRAGRLATLQQARPEQREAATAQLKQHLEVAQRSNFDIVREGAEIFAQAQLDFDRIYHPERVAPQSAAVSMTPTILDDDECEEVE